MKILKVFLTVLTFVALVALQNSGAQAIQEFTERPFGGYFDCLDEGGTGSITFHHVLLYDKSDKLKALHSNIVEGWFVGESGTVYKVILTRKYSQQIRDNNMQQTDKLQITFKLISPKNGKSFQGYANLQFTINALGRLTVEREEIDLCFDPLGD